MNEQIESNRYYSLKDICEYLGVKRDTIFKWIKTREMPAAKIGRQWRFKLSEVEEWVKSGKAAE